MIKATTIIQRADEYLSIGDHRKIKDGFLEKYSMCEVLCRSIVKDYLKEIGEYTTDEEIGMDLKLIQEALSDSGYVFEDEKLLTRIWGKSQVRDSSSCRFLRNKITHELMERALHEVVERQNEINADMDTFLETLKNN